LLCTHLIPVDLRKQLRTNRGASDQDKSGSQKARNPERKAEPIVIPGFQIPFLVFRFDFIHSLPSRRLDAGSGGPLAPRTLPLMLSRLTFLLLRHDEILSISARLLTVVNFLRKIRPRRVDVGDFRLNMLIPRKRELL
jgi:hypothetical protein